MSSDVEKVLGFQMFNHLTSTLFLVDLTNYQINTTNSLFFFKNGSSIQILFGPEVVSAALWLRCVLSVTPRGGGGVRGV